MDESGSKYVREEEGFDVKVTKPYSINTFKDTYQIYELTEASTGSRVRIAPERGGMVIGFEAYGRELLYLDTATFNNPQANVRGGIPILFPICGFLENGSYEWNGDTYTMKNHGVARTNAWTVIDSQDDSQASVKLRLQSTEATKEAYPFDFELIFTYILQSGSLHIVQEYYNRSQSDMPVYVGLHPYFKTNAKNLAYATDATAMLDLNDYTQKPFDGSLDLTGKKEALVLLGQTRPEIAFQPTDDYSIRLEYGEQFKYVLLWHEQEKPFVCVEPWMALSNEMNAKQELTLVPAGGVLRTHCRVSCNLTG